MKQSFSQMACRPSAVAALFIGIGTLQLTAQPAPELEDTDNQSAVTLEQLVDGVLQNNPELEFYEAEIEAARGGRRQSGIYENPELSASAGARRIKSAGMSTEGTAWSVSVMQTFEYPGRMGLRKSIANRDLELAELGLKQFRAALDSEARTLGYHLHLAHLKAEAATEVADRLQELLDFMVQREPGGITPLVELRIIEASVVTFRKKAIEASEALQSALFDVNRLRGKPLETPLNISEAEPDFPEPHSVGLLVEAAMENSFEVRMRHAELEQQGFQLALERNLRWPDISVGPYVSQEANGEQETVFGIGLSLPLPMWNRNAGSIQVEAARERQAEVSLFLTQLEVKQAVMEHHLAYRLKVKEMNRWPDNSIQRFHEASELGDRHYRLGSLPVATYTELQREYLDALEAILALQSEALEAKLKLEVLTGISIGKTSNTSDE